MNIFLISGGITLVVIGVVALIYEKMTRDQFVYTQMPVDTINYHPVHDEKKQRDSRIQPYTNQV
jgi:hypothetical protein